MLEEERRRSYTLAKHWSESDGVKLISVVPVAKVNTGAKAIILYFFAPANLPANIRGCDEKLSREQG